VDDACATVTPTPTHTATATATPTFTPTACPAGSVPVDDACATVTPTPTHTATATPTPTFTPTACPAGSVPVDDACATVTPTPTHTATATPSATGNPTVTPSVTSTATDTPTSTPTLTVTPTATSTNTNTPSPTPTSVSIPGTDDYEPNDTCAQANLIGVDGVPQFHDFYVPNDVDWIRFNAVAGREYIAQVDVGPTSSADVTLEVYMECEESTLPEYGQGYTFSPGVRLQFTAPHTGSVYLKLVHSDPEDAEGELSYQLTVREMADVGRTGAAIVVAGAIRSNDPVQPNIESVSDIVYDLLLNYGYTHEQITYLAPSLHSHRVTSLATAMNLRAAITSWARDKVGPDRALTIYFMDHGSRDLLYLDKRRGEWVTPQQLDLWLSELETAVPGVKVNIIIEACYAGSFISGVNTISRPDRVVIASTGDNHLAWASDTGAYFSDYLLAALSRQESLASSYQKAAEAAQIANPAQAPWIDSNGNGIPNEAEDLAIAAQRGFAYRGTLSDYHWPPHIARVVPPPTINAGRGLIRADVRDDVRVAHVWAIIYPPSYQPIEESEALVQEALPTIKLLDQGNNWFGAYYNGFDESGVYRIVIFAEDTHGYQARPTELFVRTGYTLFLPYLSSSITQP
jgi:hypothetical protein